MNGFKVGDIVTFQNWCDQPCVVVANRQGTSHRWNPPSLLLVDRGGTRWTAYNASDVTKTGDTADVFLAEREDKYDFYGVVWTIKGRRVNAVVSAGCRQFTTLKQAERHWTKRQRYDKPNKKDARLNKWSIAFAKKVFKLQAKLKAAR